MTAEETINIIENIRFQFQCSLDEVDVDKDCAEAKEDNQKVVEALDKAIEALKPKTAHWIFKEFDEETGISNSFWCSACNYPMAQVYDDCCAHCGVKMERERVHGKRKTGKEKEKC